MEVYQVDSMKYFKCLKDRCHDDCCSGWTVNVNYGKLEEWEQKSPELLDYIEENPYRPDRFRMQLGRDSKKSCKMLKDGLCEIQCKYSREYLPDVCNTFPFTIQKTDDDYFISGTIACPAVAEICLKESKTDNYSLIKCNPTANIMKSIEVSPHNTINDNYDTEYCIEVRRKILSRLDEFSSSDNAVLWLMHIGYRFYDSLSCRKSRTVNGCFTLAELDMMKDKLYCSKGKNTDIIFTYIKRMMELLNRIATRRRPVIDSIFNSIEVEFKDWKFVKKKIDNWIKGNPYDKWLIRFLKAKLTEKFFPFNIKHENDISYIVNIVVEYLLIRFVLIVEFDGSSLKKKRFIKICQAVDREFYSKKTDYISDLTVEAKLDSKEILIEMVNAIPQPGRN